jgi:hypothetical protein
MADHSTTDGRTDTKRFSDDVDAETLIEGDRIDKRLVARTASQLGQPITSQQDAPDTQLVAITQLSSMDNVHSAILADPETGTMIRAGRHDSSQAWSQQEADWKVREIGTTVAVETVHELELSSNDEPADDAREYVQGWVEIVIGDAANGHDDYSDERELDGRTLRLRDVDGRHAVATISLGGDDD